MQTMRWMAVLGAAAVLAAASSFAQGQAPPAAEATKPAPKAADKKATPEKATAAKKAVPKKDAAKKEAPKKRRARRRKSSWSPIVVLLGCALAIGLLSGLVAVVVMRRQAPEAAPAQNPSGPSMPTSPSSIDRSAP